MKKTIALCLTAVLVLALLAGCGKQAPLATGQHEGGQITVRPHASTDLTPVGLYGFTQNTVIVLGDKGFFPVNTEGERLGEDTYAMLYSYGADGRALAQTQQGAWVWLDTTGTVVGTADAPQSSPAHATEKYESSAAGGAGGEDGAGLFGVKDSATGDPLTAPVFTWIAGVDDPLNYAVLAQGEHRNVMISPQGKVMLTLPDDCTSAFLRDEHMICGFGKGVYRLADTQGRLLNERAFTSISPFSDGLAVVTDGAKLGLIAADGTVVIEPQIDADQPVDQMVPYIWKNYIVCVADGRMAILTIERS